MSTINPLSPDDFPLLAKGQYVYRRTNSSPIIGPVSVELAEDLAARLNRDAFAGAHEAIGTPVRDGPFNTVLAR